MKWTVFPPSSSRRGSEDITNPYRHRTYEKTSFGGDISDITPLIDRSTVEEQREKAWGVLKREYPNASPSLIVDYNKDGRLTAKMSEAKRDYTLFTKNRTTGEQQINLKTYKMKLFKLLVNQLTELLKLKKKKSQDVKRN